MGRGRGRGLGEQGMVELKGRLQAASISKKFRGCTAKPWDPPPSNQPGGWRQ